MKGDISPPDFAFHLFDLFPEFITIPEEFDIRNPFDKRY